MTALQALRAEQIRIVDAKDLVTAANEAEYNTALEANKDAIGTLRAALEKQELVGTAFTDHAAKPLIVDVVAADVLADGSLVIYFRKNPG